MGIGLVVFAIMRTWRWGRKATFAAYKAKHTMTMRRLVEIHKKESTYMERIGLLMTPKHLSSLNDNAPALLQLLYDRYGILPRHLIFVQVAHRKVPSHPRWPLRHHDFPQGPEFEHHSRHVAVRLHGGAER